MVIWYKTQAEFDSTILTIVDYEVRFADRVAKLRRANDVDAFRLEEELMFLQNVIAGLQNYDIDSDILTDDEIEYMYELATNVIQNHSIS